MVLPESPPKWQPVLAEHSDLAHGSPRRVVRVGRVRLPLAGPYRPWATLYRLPDARQVWCVRLWNRSRVEPRCFGTDVLRRFAQMNRLTELASAIEELVARADEDRL